MKPLGGISTHLMRVRRMARASGADVVAAFRNGTLTQEDWAGLVQTCRTCGWESGCGRHLDRVCATPEAAAVSAAPDECLNHALFNSLAEETLEQAAPSSESDK